MTHPIDSFADAALALRDAWRAAGGEVSAMTGPEVLGLSDRLGEVRRRLDSALVLVAAEVAARSRPEFGKDGLARRAGHRSPAKLIAAATGGHVGDAVRLLQVGEATRERTLLSGQAVPAAHPHVADALARGALSVSAAAAIAAMLDRVALRVPVSAREAAEKTIVAQAPRLTLDELHAVLRRAEAHLDPDGLAPAIDRMRGENSLTHAQDASGMTVITARLDPESAAPVIAAIEGIVTHQLRVSRGGNVRGGATSGRHDPADSPPPVAPAEKSVRRLRAEALATVCRHVLASESDALPAGVHTTVVVRMTLDQLRGEGGVATIDGSSSPIDAGTARRLAAAADVIPSVLGGDSEVLDWGRTRRHFTRAQRRALVERDGGCAFCGLPPAFAEAHHLRWWERDRGRTDLDNGILLCTGCHHRVHDDGWDIRIEAPPGGAATAGTVWLVPPPFVDPAREPRLGGRRRFDPLAWGAAA